MADMVILLAPESEPLRDCNRPRAHVPLPTKPQKKIRISRMSGAVGRRKSRSSQSWRQTRKFPSPTCPRFETTADFSVNAWPRPRARDFEAQDHEGRWVTQQFWPPHEEKRLRTEQRTFPTASGLSPPPVSPSDSSRKGNGGTPVAELTDI